MVNGENLNIRIQVGAVSNPQIYFRVSLHNDANVRSQIASAIGVHPEAGFVFARVGAGASTQDLNEIFQNVTMSGSYEEHVQQGNVQEFPIGSDKWLRFSLDHVAGGMISQNVIPLLASDPNIGGALELVVESDNNGEDLAALKAANQTIAYALFRSFKLHVTTSLSEPQFKAISQLVEGITGQALGNLSALHSNLGLTRRRPRRGGSVRLLGTGSRRVQIPPP
jgi:hypothetical protein